MTLYCAIDLHSNNNVPVVIDENDKVLFSKRLPNHLPTIVDSLKPYKAELQSVAVESTFNWYWLVDGLSDNDFTTCLVNPGAVVQYNGIKNTNDESDAFHLAHLMRLGILPTGYIYPKQQRAVRDLLRKRLQMVRHRVTHMLSAQNQLWRTTGENITNKRIKQADYSLLDLVDDRNVKTAIKANLDIIAALNELMPKLEHRVIEQVEHELPFNLLQTVNGIGPILALTILLETGDITRFSKVGNYASYCRCVQSTRVSNDKKKGSNNRRNGNKYLSWAFVEAAHSIIRNCKPAHKFYQRKRAQKNGALATKALAHKLARACYFILRDQQPFELKRLFG